MPATSNVPTAVDPVQSATLAGSAPIHDFSPWGMFIQADLVVKAVMIGLVLMSFWCWAIIFEKWIMLRAVRAKAGGFERDFWSSEALDKFHDKVKKRVNHPMAVIFVAAMEEWFRSKPAAMAASMKAAARERIMQIMQVARNREVEKLENGLSFLAITSSSAPFIGLFGTVWGIMNSFHGIAMSKNTSLAAVAPGISEALFATAVGLMAAIPAYMAYNKFTREIATFAGRMEDFSLEFNTILSRQMEA
jgi:biopolymer transport protein TolQ